VQCGDFKQVGTKCGGHGKSCLEIIRHRRLCDLPCAKEGRTAECCSVRSVVFLRDFVVVVLKEGSFLATAGHGVCAGASGDKSSDGVLAGPRHGGWRGLRAACCQGVWCKEGGMLPVGMDVANI
jgi:hypothetical protein